MLRPAQDVFVDLAARGNLVPVVREILADLDTPLSLYRRLDDGRTTFLLESVEGGEKWGRYSFIGVGARAIFRARGNDVEWVEGGATRSLHTEGDPLEVLRERIASQHPVFPDGLELPRFVGGAVGMVGYDWVRFVEDIADANPDRIDLPDLWFVFPETVVVYDRARHTALLVRMVQVDGPGDAAAAYRRAGEEIEALVRRLRAPMPPEPERPGVRAPMDVRYSMTREEFHDIVKRAKEYIEAGDIFQVVLSQLLELPLQGDPFLI